VAVVTGLLFGLAPAWQATRADAADGLRDGRGSAGPASRRLRGALTTAEVALSLVVVVGAGLLVQSLVRLLRVDAGFTAPERVLTFNVQMLGGRPPERRAALSTALVERLARIPGVTAVGGGTGLPPATAQRATAFAVDGLADRPGDERRALFLAVTPDYFRALGTPVVEGRPFQDGDAAGAPEVVILNRALARRLFEGRSAIGQRVKLVNPEYPDSWRTVVGVVGEVRYSGLDDPGEAALYTPFAQTPFLWTYVMVRTSVPPMQVARAVGEAVREVDPGLEAAALRPLSDVVSETVAQPRFQVALVSSFAVLALLLAAVGIYGVLSYSVAQRTREIGIRMALGADRGAVLRLVTGEGLRLALAGVVVGLLGAAGATRVLAGLLFDVRPLDLPTFAAAAAGLALVALAASAVPALRASRVAPMSALRQD
jgi:putative ABC transport system permease protein